MASMERQIISKISQTRLTRNIDSLLFLSSLWVITLNSAVKARIGFHNFCVDMGPVISLRIGDYSIGCLFLIFAEPTEHTSLACLHAPPLDGHKRDTDRSDH